MVNVILYDKTLKELSGGGYVTDTVTARTWAKKLIKETANAHCCKLEVLKDGIGSRIVAESYVFGR